MREVHIELGELASFIKKVIIDHQFIQNINEYDFKTYFVEIIDLTEHLSNYIQVIKTNVKLKNEIMEEIKTIIKKEFPLLN